MKVSYSYPCQDEAPAHGKPSGGKFSKTDFFVRTNTEEIIERKLKSVNIIGGVGKANSPEFPAYTSALLHPERHDEVHELLVSWDREECGVQAIDELHLNPIRTYVCEEVEEVTGAERDLILLAGDLN